MNVVPAQVAGVSEVALASPPQREHGGRVHPVILAAARLLGVDEVYAMGGAGAIGAFAYGVAGIGLEPVDVVSGPGNNFVAAAKRAVAGVVGTDAEAGATEILIVADAAADARLVAVDLISQAEHDEQASAVLVTDSEALAEAVAREVAPRAARTRHAERVAAALAGPAVGDRARRRPRRGDGVQQRVRAGAPRAAPGRPAARRTSCTPARCSSGRTRRSASATTSPAATTCCRPAARRATRAGLSAATFLRPQQVIEYDRAALAAGPRRDRDAGRGRAAARARRGGRRPVRG